MQSRVEWAPAAALALRCVRGTRMQAAYDTWHAERTEDVRHIPTIKAKAPDFRDFPANRPDSLLL